MRESMWTVRRRADICWRDWDGLGVVYDDSSGDTHLVDALAIEFLEMLARQQLCVAQLVDQLADALPEQMDVATATAFFDRQLHALQDLGLVEQIATPA
ncbi:HPr-rel-A system PqqD family peptide chaperone [Roseateles sp. DC23W]|uniref:HPr-rel-A system PqqD family peptide chaperone n=1 Tax=Pelomonas dachongensis TaxID=3299029 RepID=A0ABW7EI49_9BURK